MTTEERLSRVAPLLRGLCRNNNGLALAAFSERAPEQPAEIRVAMTASDFEDDGIVLDRLRNALKGRTKRADIHVEGLGAFSVRPGDGEGRLAGKIALVTGAAQGVGKEIAQAMADEGARVVLGDINGDGVRQVAESIGARHGAERVMGGDLDVTRPESWRRLIDRLLARWGGVDVLVANAGVLRAGSVKTQPVSDFEWVTRVNCTGYFLGVQAVAPVMAQQRKAAPGQWFDIVHINSKSGLQGSKCNAAYAGSKFGGIGMTQSFALELIEDGIKVNAVCPGNFYDGPLWADPVNGLFVQYLKANKVPGARTVDDVRKAYEAKTPMQRGCRVADVMKAALYLIEQEYETGQAVPVTGGQIMLS